MRARFIRSSRLGVVDRVFAGLDSEAPRPERIMIDAAHLGGRRTVAGLPSEECGRWLLSSCFQTVMRSRAWGNRVSSTSLRSSSRKLPLKRAIKPFWIAMLVNSVQLSETMTLGGPGPCSCSRKIPISALR